MYCSVEEIHIYGSIFILPPLLPMGLLSRFILRYCSYDVYNDRGAEPGGTAVERLTLSLMGGLFHDSGVPSLVRQTIRNAHL